MSLYWDPLFRPVESYAKIDPNDKPAATQPYPDSKPNNPKERKHRHFPFGHHIALPAPIRSTFTHKSPQPPVQLPYQPLADVRETKWAYVLDIELPGVTNAEDLVIEWM